MGLLPASGSLTVMVLPLPLEKQSTHPLFQAFCTAACTAVKSPEDILQEQLITRPANSALREAA